MAVTAAIGGVVVSAAGVAAGARESQLAREQARDAMNVPKPVAKQLPQGSIADSADQIKKANILAQQAGGSLLSDPVQDARQGVGSAVKAGASLLGS